MPTIDSKRMAAKNKYNVAAPESWAALLGNAKELLVELSAAKTQVTLFYTRGMMMAERACSRCGPKAS